MKHCNDVGQIKLYLYINIYSTLCFKSLGSERCYFI